MNPDPQSVIASLVQAMNGLTQSIATNTTTMQLALTQMRHHTAATENYTNEIKALIARLDGADVIQHLRH